MTTSLKLQCQCIKEQTAVTIAILAVYSIIDIIFPRVLWQRSQARK